MRRFELRDRPPKQRFGFITPENRHDRRGDPEVESCRRRRQGDLRTLGPATHCIQAKSPPFEHTILSPGAAGTKRAVYDREDLKPGQVKVARPGPHHRGRTHTTVIEDGWAAELTAGATSS